MESTSGVHERTMVNPRSAAIDMRRNRKALVRYFQILGVLSVIALIPGAALILLVISVPLLGLPGLLVIASPTILIYSAALVPLWLALTAPLRSIWRIAAAALIPVAVAAGPSLLSHQEARQFGMRMSKDDMSLAPTTKPRSIELIGDGTSGVFVNAQAVGAELASCDDICRRLLLNGEVDWVRMTHISDFYMNERSGKTWSVTYHFEHRESCPQLYAEGATIEKAVRDRLLAGDCLIAEVGGEAAPDARVELTTSYSNRNYPSNPPDQGPITATIETVKALRVEDRRAGADTPILRQTETMARTLALPFYIGAAMNMQGGYNGPTIGRDKTVMTPINLAQAIGDAFGFRISAISAPPSEDAGKMAERILALPREANVALSTQQQDALNDVLSKIEKQPALSDADVDFVRRVIADNRVTEAKLGVVIQNMFREHAARLQPLIPVVLDRISTPVPERIGHYQSMLGWSVANYSADILQPYRVKIVAIVEAQADWPSAGLLTRLGELAGDEAVGLAIRRLDSTSVRKFAAVAACRASAEAWPTLEPAVLAHLTPPRQGSGMQDDEWLLLLALVRFGEKPLVADMIEKRGLLDKKRTVERLARFEPGFSPERCRDFL